MIENVDIKNCIILLYCEKHNTMIKCSVYIWDYNILQSNLWSFYIVLIYALINIIKIRDDLMKRKPLIISISVVTAVLLVFGGIYIYASSMLNKIKKVQIPKSNEDLGISSKSYEAKGVVNIVFFGLDRRNPDQASRSDSIMVVSIDNINKKVKVTSLMRDMYVPIPGKESNRINAAYAYGGPLLSIKTINSDFNLDIKNYVAVDFFGLEKLIDKVGGVQINVSAAEAKVLNNYMSELNNLNGDKAPDVKAGLQTLNGRQAVAYSRIRYVGHADYERTERQRRVLNELFKKIKAQGTVKIPGIISQLLPYVETSLTNSEILDYALECMKFNTNSIDQYRLPVDGYFKSESIRGMSVLVPDMEKNKSLLHDFIYGKK